MTTDIDDRLATAIHEIAGAARADRDEVRRRIVDEARPRRRATRQPVGDAEGRSRSITVAAACVAVALGTAGVVAIVHRSGSGEGRGTVISPSSPSSTAGGAVPDVPIETAGSPTSTTPTSGGAVSVPPVETASPPTAAAHTYRVQAGDTIRSVAYQFCTMPEALVAVNGWPASELDRLPVGAAERIAVPEGSCVSGSPLPGGSEGRQPGSIIVIGDNEAAAIAATLTAAGETVVDESHPHSGLARPDYFDWPTTISVLLPQMPDGAPVVIAIGGSDFQVATRADGSGDTWAFGTPEWFTEYMARVRGVAKSVVAAGHPLVWVGVHAGNESTVDAATQVADATDYAVEQILGVVQIRGFDVLRGPDGSSLDDTVQDPLGNPVVVRQGGYPLTAAGVAVLTERVWTALGVHGFEAARPAAVEPVQAVDTASPQSESIDFRDILASDGLTYHVRLEVESTTVSGICLIVGGQVSGCDTAPADLSPAVVLWSGAADGTSRIIYGFVDDGLTPILRSALGDVPILVTEPVEGRRAFVTVTPADPASIVVMDATGTVVREVAIDQ